MVTRPMRVTSMRASARASARTRRNAGFFGASAVALGLLMLYPTSTNSSSAGRRAGQSLAPVGVVSAPTAGTPTAPTPTAGAAAPPVVATTVVNGTSIDTQYGPVQVQLAIRGGRIVRATAIDFPQGGGRNQEINSYAIPLLQRETLAAQNAHIDTISGASFTSAGYEQSLQAALDAAHIG